MQLALIISRAQSTCPSLIDFIQLTEASQEKIVFKRDHFTSEFVAIKDIKYAEHGLFCVY